MSSDMSSTEATRRAELLKKLAEFNTPLEPLLVELAAFCWDWTEEPLLVFTPSHLISALDRFIAGNISAAQLEYWANIFEVRDDVCFETNELKNFIFRLANPSLNVAITPENIRKMKTELGSAG